MEWERRLIEAEGNSSIYAVDMADSQEEARQTAESLIAKARSEIQRERDGAIDELRREFTDLTILAAGKVIDRSLDKKAHSQLIDKMLEESPTLEKG